MRTREGGIISFVHRAPLPQFVSSRVSTRFESNLFIKLKMNLEAADFLCKQYLRFYFRALISKKDLRYA